MSVSFAVAALASLTANVVFKKMNMSGSLGMLLAGRLPGHFALRGGRVPMINVRAGLITPTTRAFAAIELRLCVRVMAQEVLFP